jgi:hypothetical protein
LIFSPFLLRRRLSFSASLRRHARQPPHTDAVSPLSLFSFSPVHAAFLFEAILLYRYFFRFQLSMMRDAIDYAIEPHYFHYAWLILAIFPMMPPFIDFS